MIQSVMPRRSKTLPGLAERIADKFDELSGPHSISYHKHTASIEQGVDGREMNLRIKDSVIPL
ncbi:MAG: hypothetical protein XE11_2069 [Methanomicrobiales archaeon 53_19]|nr:MAG: hypothetical protein XE11_2069 [Methanomicrobiales archaeon 53_19]